MSSVRMSEREYQELLARNNGLRPSRLGCGVVSPPKTGGVKAKKQKVPTLSPHARRLAQLAKHPELKSGGVYRGKKIQANHEHFEQVMIFDYFDRHYPDIYELLASTPNGGMRSKKVAYEMQAEGQKRGYPDIKLEMKRGVYSGLRIELKKKSGGTLHDDQKRWLNLLTREGFYCNRCNGNEEAVKLILEYYRLKPGEKMPENEATKLWLMEENS